MDLGYSEGVGIFLGILGIFIVVTTLLDMIMSAFSISKVGWYTHSITLSYKTFTSTLDRFLLQFTKHSRVPIIRNFRFQRPIGILTLVTVLVFWLVSAWVGWSLIFMLERGAVWSNAETRVATIWERFYLSGISISALGMGDVVGRSPTSQLIVVLATFHGILIVAISTAYILNVVPFVAQMKSMSNMIFCVGESPYEVLYRCWDSKNKNFGKLDDILLSLLEKISAVTQGFRAFPIMQNFLYDPKPANNVLVNLAVLHETLFLMSYAIEPEYQVDQLTLNAVKKSLHIMLNELSQFYWGQSWLRIFCYDNLNIKILEKPTAIPFHDKWLNDFGASHLPIRRDILQVREKLMQSDKFHHNRFILKELLDREAIPWETVFYTEANFAEFINYKRAVEPCLHPAEHSTFVVTTEASQPQQATEA